MTVTGAGRAEPTPAASYTNNVNAGTATASSTFAGDANHTGSSDTEDVRDRQGGVVTTVTVAGGAVYLHRRGADAGDGDGDGAGRSSLTPTAGLHGQRRTRATATASYAFLPRRRRTARASGQLKSLRHSTRERSRDVGEPLQAEQRRTGDVRDPGG